MVASRRFAKLTEKMTQKHGEALRGSSPVGVEIDGWPTVRVKWTVEQPTGSTNGTCYCTGFGARGITMMIVAPATVGPEAYERAIRAVEQLKFKKPLPTQLGAVPVETPLS